MKVYGFPVFIFSLIEWVLALLPLYWLAPKMYGLFLSSFLNSSLLLHLVPYVLAWLIYIFMVRLFLLYMQFGYTSGTGMFSSLFICIKSLIPAIGISIILGAAGLILLLACGLSGIFCPIRRHFLFVNSHHCPRHFSKCGESPLNIIYGAVKHFHNNLWHYNT